MKKTKTRRSVAEDICEEKGEGMWADKEDCKKYYVCRSISTAWGEKKEEYCYPGSYFDKAMGQCKWVGEGNFDCVEILAQNAEIDGAKATKNEKSGDAEDMSSEPSIVPESKYTCRADSDDGSSDESNPDNAKCFACEAEVDNPQKCNGKPDNQTAETVLCNIKTKKCFSRAVYKKSNNQLESFSRGCASIADLSKNKIAQTSSVGNNRAVCIRDSSKLKTCFVVCESNLCNTITEIKSAALTLKSTLNFNIILPILSLISFLLQ